MVNLPMVTHWVGVYGIWVTVQGIYTKCTWQIYYLYKGVQDYYLWRILSDSEKLVCLFLLTEDKWHFLHTLVKHAFISCTLSNLYMAIWISTSLMMIVKQNYTTIFLLS